MQKKIKSMNKLIIQRTNIKLDKTHNKREINFKIKNLVRKFFEIFFLDLLMILLGDQIYFVDKLVDL